MDTNAHLVWTCEAFGIPEVYYNWYKNGIEIGLATMSPEVIFANKFCSFKINNNCLYLRM